MLYSLGTRYQRRIMRRNDKLQKVKNGAIGKENDCHSKTTTEDRVVATESHDFLT